MSSVEIRHGADLFILSFSWEFDCDGWTRSNLGKCTVVECTMVQVGVLVFFSTA